MSDVTDKDSTKEKESAPSTDNSALVNLSNRLLDLHDRDQLFRNKELKWKNIRTGVWVIAVVIIPSLWLILGTAKFMGLTHHNGSGGYVSLVKVMGMISPDSDASSLRIDKALNEAFSDKKSKGVVILINSPGGTPVQASNIHERIVELRDKYPNKLVVAVGEDDITSGAYMVATGAPKIYVNAASITGSIGVIMDGFAYNKIMKRYGLERRTLTAGIYKDRMSPYYPMSPGDKAKFQGMLDQIHQYFISLVLQTRKGKLKGSPQMLFSGDVWTGQRAVQLGLVDGIMSFSDVMTKIFHVHRYKDYTEAPSFITNIKKKIFSSFENAFFSVSDYHVSATM